MGLWISRTNFYSICENFVIMMVESSYFCMVAGSGCKSFILLLLNYFIEDERTVICNALGLVEVVDDLDVMALTPPSFL